MDNFDSEIIDISTIGESDSININNEFEKINLNSESLSPSNEMKPSVNFGGGIELLMNDKKKKESNTDKDVEISDLNNLEQELNDLSSEQHVTFEKVEQSPSIGIETAKQNNEDKRSWDGFPSINNLPNNPDIEIPDKPKLSQEELIREKFKYLRRLEELEKKGVTLTKKYTMESSLSEMQGEYELILSEKEKSNSCKFQGRMLMAAVTGIEFKYRFDPFDTKLDGWAEQVNENIDDYDECCRIT